MTRPVMVLCEDKQHSAFVLRFLQKKLRTVKVAPVFSGAGSAEKHVRDEYPKQLVTARKKRAALIVITDGDNVGRRERLRQLDEACREQGVNTPDKTEAVAIFVPERAIEDWIHYLDGGGGTGKLKRESECRHAVRKLLAICDDGADLPDDFPDSLRAACDEWRRFRKVAP